MKKYELTEEHRAQLPAWRDMWIARILSTEPMSAEERERAIVATKGLYAAADLTPPERIIFVRSPIEGAFVYGFNEAILRLGIDHPLVETLDLVEPGKPGKNSKWFSNVSVRARELAKAIAGDLSEELIKSAKRATEAYNGGNFYAQYVSFLSFFRHVAKLDIDYSKWHHYEELATVSGPRFMHEKFCVISDRPEVLTKDAQNRPHADNGPFCRWRDGFSMYSVHGTRVPAWVIESPELVTVADIDGESNEEVRRVMIERYGVEKYVADADFKVVDSDVDGCGQPRRLLKRHNFTVVDVVNSTADADGTRRRYFIPVDPGLRPLLPDGRLGDPQKLTVLNAVASTFGLTGKEYVLAQET